ncbi:MAG: hypothetical protein H7Y20_00555 [Bryobacteraceae bacterium]|nr:hypothetical protein [Bryobacteraceae bacterium]
MVEFLRQKPHKDGVNSALLILIALLVAGAVSPVNAQSYGGPSLLSRGGNQPGRRGKAPVEFTYFAGAGGRYETGLIAPALEDGTLVTRDQYGATADFGIFGGHDWRRSSIGLDYRGDFRQNSVATQSNGTNHVVALEYSLRPRRRLVVTLRETGGTTNRAFGGLAGPAFPDTARLGVPINELFDVRTYFSQASAFANYQKSARLSFGGGMDVFFVKRSGFSLINSQGYTATGLVSYRVNRRDTVSGQYQHMVFDFPKVLASSTVDTFSGRYERHYGRSLTVNVLAGLLRIRSSGTEIVQLSPEVAEILGRPTGQAFFVRQSIKPNLDVNVSWLQDRGRLFFNAQNGVGAGNGVFLTTVRRSAHAGYSYTGIRKVSLGISGGWTKTDSAALSLPGFRTWQGGGGFAYKLVDKVNLTGQLDYRSIGGAVTGRSGISASVGMTWSSSRLPLSIW